MHIGSSLGASPKSVGSRVLATVVLPAVVVLAILTATNNRLGLVTISADVTLSPGLLLDVMAIIVAIAGLEVLRSYYRATGDQYAIEASAIVLMTGVCVFLSAATMLVASVTLSWAHTAGGITIVLLAVGALRERQHGDYFATHVTLVVRAAAIGAAAVLLLVLATSLEPTSNVLAVVSSAAIAASGLVLTIVGLRNKHVGRQLVGLVVLSAATLGTHMPGSEVADVPVLVHKATMVGLLATVALHTLVELRNSTMSTQSTFERASEDLFVSNGLLEKQREERAQLVHDSRNALLVVQAGLRSVATEESEALIASLTSELNRIQAMIERTHTPIEAIDVVETLMPMIRCYESGGITLLVHADGEPPFIALSSRTQLLEIMQNLIENAIRHAASPLPIEILFRAGDGHIEIDVRDHGQGIDLRDRLPLTDRVAPISGLGSGLGLSICRRMVAEMNGSLEFVNPVVGSGSIVRVRMPAAAATLPFPGQAAS